MKKDVMTIIFKEKFVVVPPRLIMIKKIYSYLNAYSLAFIALRYSFTHNVMLLQGQDEMHGLQGTILQVFL